MRWFREVDAIDKDLKRFRLAREGDAGAGQAGRRDQDDRGWGRGARWQRRVVHPRAGARAAEGHRPGAAGQVSRRGTGQPRRGREDRRAALSRQPGADQRHADGGRPGQLLGRRGQGRARCRQHHRRDLGRPAGRDRERRLRRLRRLFEADDDSRQVRQQRRPGPAHGAVPDPPDRADVRRRGLLGRARASRSP